MRIPRPSRRAKLYSHKRTVQLCGGGFLVQPDDFDRLQISLVRLGQDAGLRRRFGRNGRALIEKSFDVAIMVQRIHELYGRLLSKEAA